MPEQNAVLMFTPKITVRAERVAEILCISIEKANELLSQFETKQILTKALEQSFQATVDKILTEMARLPTVAVASPRVDCAVSIDQISFSSNINAPDTTKMYKQGYAYGKRLLAEL